MYWFEEKVCEEQVNNTDRPSPKMLFTARAHRPLGSDAL
jgi:hypothetical protein